MQQLVSGSLHGGRHGRKYLFVEKLARNLGVTVRQLILGQAQAPARALVVGLGPFKATNDERKIGCVPCLDRTQPLLHALVDRSGNRLCRPAPCKAVAELLRRSERLFGGLLVSQPVQAERARV